MSQPEGLDPRDLEVVLVSYRSKGHVETLLASWPRALAVAVVDNSGNSDGTADVVAQYPAARYLDGGGQGFARAANLGAMSSTADFVVFVNPDTRPSYEDLTALTEGLSKDPEAASHAATVTGRDGDVEIGVGGWEPTLRRSIIHGIGLHKAFRRAGLFAKPALGAPETVDWTTGACMAVKRKLFSQLGGFDEMFYVYAEDMSFGRRVRLARLKQILRPDVVVRHGAGSSGAPSKEMLRLRGASMNYYMREYHNPVRRIGVLGSTAVGYALRAARARKQGDPALAEQYGQFIRGLLTGRATVGGQEVARARHTEVVGPRSH